jgi:quercetin dioxygenase-like cupin family protein
MKKFPEFMTGAAHRVADPPDPSVQGFVFHGRKDMQVVFWQCDNGGEQPEQVHDFWEYALVVEGTFEGEVGGRRVSLKAGDECVIPPGTRHSGRYSKGYRAIDIFSARRVNVAE